MSWGHKYGNPPANFKFDVSYFKNPWREKEIKDHQDRNERKKKIIEFMKNQEGVETIVVQVSGVIALYDLLFPNENISVAICCSAGEFRSPAIVELIGKELSKRKVKYTINHSKESLL
jgi:UPF0042 nucleotide-binding protein